MIIYIKDGVIEKAVVEEFDNENDIEKYDQRIETTDFEISDNLVFEDGEIKKIEIEEPNQIMEEPQE